MEQTHKLSVVTQNYAQFLAYARAGREPFKVSTKSLFDKVFRGSSVAVQDQAAVQEKVFKTFPVPSFPS